MTLDISKPSKEDPTRLEHPSNKLEQFVGNVGDVVDAGEVTLRLAQPAKFLMLLATFKFKVPQLEILVIFNLSPPLLNSHP